MKNVVGTTVIPVYGAGELAALPTWYRSAFALANFCKTDMLSELIPITTKSCGNSSATFCKCGISRTQGPHQVAQ